MTAQVELAPSLGPDTYWQRLHAAVRPEFQVDAYEPKPGDRVLGSTKSDGRRALAARCGVRGCENQATGRGWCRPHYNLWRGSKPADFANTAPPAERVGICRVPGCGRPRWIERTGLCESHREHWRHAGEPPLEVFLAEARPIRSARIVYSFAGLAPGPKLELQYAMQRRHDDGGAQLRPKRLALIVAAVCIHDPGCASLLDRPLADWEQFLRQSWAPAESAQLRQVSLAFLRWAYDELRLFAGTGDPYEPDRWDVRQVAPLADSGGCRWIDWTGILQPWLRQAGKRWGRLRLTTQAVPTVAADARNLTRFAVFLAEQTTVSGPAEITRHTVESYIGHVGTVHGRETRSRILGSLRLFLETCREQEYLPLHPSAVVRQGDFPRPKLTLPRYLPEPVMAALEDPANQALLPDNGLRHLVQVLMGTARRASEVCRLPFDCLVIGPDGDPYLRYYASKTSAEQTIPIDPSTRQAIEAQQRRVLKRWPDGCRWLFPRPKSNPHGRYPFSYEQLRHGLDRWVRQLDLRQPLPPDAPPGAKAPYVNLTAHRFRHTIATRMINEDVPEWVVQRFLGHESPEMTKRYAAIHDRTLKEAFDTYRHRVTATGQVVEYESDTPISDGMHLADRLKRARQTLPNGYCARPLQTECIHPNYCHGCTQFAADVTFLPVLRGQRDRAQRMLDQCNAEGRGRWAERNERDIAALDRIITTLETLPEATDFGADPLSPGGAQDPAG